MYNSRVNEEHLQSKRAASGLLKAIGQASHLIESRLDAALDAHGLSIAKLEVLRQLVQVGQPFPLGQLAERLACVKSNVTHLVDRLEANGLVRRVPDPQDRRVIQVVITDEGRRRYEAGVQTEATIARELLAGLSFQEQQALFGLLDRLRSETSQSE